MSIRKLIRFVFCLIKIKTDYRITASMLINGKAATSTMTVTASPWIHYDNIKEMEEIFKKECHADSGVNLLMIFKLKTYI